MASKGCGDNLVNENTFHHKKISVSALVQEQIPTFFQGKVVLIIILELMMMSFGVGPWNYSYSVVALLWKTIT